MAFSVKTIRSMAAVMLILSADIMLPAEEKPPRSAGEQQDGIRKLRFVQDDAQDYMVSRIYTLKYVQSNDVTPFLLGMVKRYNMNSSVGCIEYGADNTQLLTVTCPVGMMPYVDDFIRKVDRNIEIDGKTPGDIIRGTGITRAVYRPKYRSGENLLNVLVNSVIGEGPYGSVYAWDANSNQIYWKDNSSNTEYVREFLGWIDRPAPQITFHFTLYEVRESMLRDVGLDYLAWKNGPGLNIFATAWEAFGVSSGGTAALQAVSGPFGGFFTAPQFDASFIRLLAQSGKAEIRNQASMTVSNSDSDSSELYFKHRQIQQRSDQRRYKHRIRRRFGQSAGIEDQPADRQPPLRFAAGRLSGDGGVFNDRLPARRIREISRNDLFRLRRRLGQRG